MGLLATATSTVNMPKPNLLSITAEAAPGTLNGCKWCQKTIVWNGGTWVHINDRHDCSHGRCRGARVEGKSRPYEVVRGLLWRRRTVVFESPVYRCHCCGAEPETYRDPLDGQWRVKWSSWCEGRVATPNGPVMAPMPGNEPKGAS